MDVYELTLLVRTLNKIDKIGPFRSVCSHGLCLDETKRYECTACYLLSGSGSIPRLGMAKDGDSILHLESKMPLSPAGPKVVKLTRRAALTVPVLGKIKPADTAPGTPLVGHNGAPPIGARQLTLGTVAGGEWRHD